MEVAAVDYGKLRNEKLQRQGQILYDAEGHAEGSAADRTERGTEGCIKE
jgi:hypothetical protein